MIQKIKDYALFILVLALGVLAYLFGRRGEKIDDLKNEIVRKDINRALDKAVSDVLEKGKSYDDALTDYTNKRNRYNKLYRGSLPKKSD